MKSHLAIGLKGVSKRVVKQATVMQQLYTNVYIKHTCKRFCYVGSCLLDRIGDGKKVLNKNS